MKEHYVVFYRILLPHLLFAMTRVAIGDVED